MKMLCYIIFYQSNRALRAESSLYSNPLLLQAIVGVISYYCVISSPSLQFLLTGFGPEINGRKITRSEVGGCSEQGSAASDWKETKQNTACPHHTLPKSRIAAMGTPAKETTLVKLLVVETAPVASKNARLLTPSLHCYC